jgi:hypothetical protein
MVALLNKLMNLNSKFLSTIDTRKTLKVSFSKPNPKTRIQRAPIAKKPLSFTGIRDHETKERIIAEFSKHDRILGSHKKQNSQTQYLINNKVPSLKFRRTPSPEKKNFRQTSSSPIKFSPSKKPDFITSEKHLKVLTQKFGQSDEDTLKLDSINAKSVESLKKCGFINDKGVINLKFVARYEQVLGARGPIGRSISSVFERSKTKLNIKLNS